MKLSNLKKNIVFVTLASLAGHNASSAFADTNHARIGAFDPEDFSGNSGLMQTHGTNAKNSGVTTVRMILSVTKYGDANNNVARSIGPQITATLARLKAMGIHTTVTISGPLCRNSSVCAQQVTSADQFGIFMDDLLDSFGSGLANVDTFEIWNEWDNGYGYWANGKSNPYSVANYTNFILKPAAEKIKARRKSIEVVSGSVVMNHESYLTQIMNIATTGGFANNIDAYGYHPYATQWSDLNARLVKAETAVASSKPLVLTEWGCDPSWQNCPATWACDPTTDTTCAKATNNFAAMMSGIMTHGSKILEIDYYIMAYGDYYKAIRILNADGSPSTMYNVFKNVTAKISNSTPTNPTNPTDPTSPTDPTNPTNPPVMTTVTLTCGSTTAATPQGCKGFYLSDTVAKPTYTVTAKSGTTCVDGSGFGIYDITTKTDAHPNTWQIYTNNKCQITLKVSYLAPDANADPANQISGAHLQSKGNSAFCANLSNASTAVGTKLMLYTCTKTANEIFTVSSKTGPIYAYNGTALCLGTSNSSTANGAGIELAKCSGGADQQWSLNSTAGTLKNSSGKCLDITQNAYKNGTLLELYTCNGGANQQWLFK